MNSTSRWIVGRGFEGVELALDDASGGAIKREPIAFLEGLPLDAHFLFLFVDDDLTGSGDAALAHAASNDRSVRGHAATRGENAGCDFHAVNVFRGGFATDEDDGFDFALLEGGHGVVGGKDDLADSGTGRCGQALGEDLNLASLLV